MRWFTSIGAVLAVGVGLGGDSPKGEPARSDRDRLQGVWALVDSIDRGESLMTPSAVEKSRLTFRGDRIRGWQESEKGRMYDSRGPFSVDPARMPKTIDYECESGAVSGTLLGIYELDGDKLRICWGGINTGFRPDKFISPKGSKVSLGIYKRISSKPESEDETR